MQHDINWYGDHTMTVWPAYLTRSPRDAGFAEVARALIGARRG